MMTVAVVLGVQRVKKHAANGSKQPRRQYLLVSLKLCAVARSLAAGPEQKVSASQQQHLVQLV
jgi:hypothetical protein